MAYLRPNNHIIKEKYCIMASITDIIFIDKNNSDEK